MKNDINVCLVIPFPPPYGGIANWSLLLKSYLDFNKTVDYCIVDTSPKRKSAKNINLFTRIVFGGLAMFGIKKDLRQKIKKNRPNVIHLTTSGRYSLIRDLQLINIANRMNIPVVYHIRYGTIPEDKLLNNWEWKLVSKLIKKTFCTIAIDKFTYNCLSCCSSGTIYQLPNPFDENKISGLEIEIKNHSKIVFYAGWVIKEKGIEELLAAWEIVSSLYSDYKLVICGPCKDNYLSYLINKFDTNRVVFEGEVKNNKLLEMMCKSEIVVLPSYSEGFPNIILEAMALAKPIIATKVGALPEMLSDDCGYLIKKQSVDDLINALKRLISDEPYRIKISENAKRKLRSKYLISTIFEDYKKIWIKAAKKDV